MSNKDKSSQISGFYKIPIEKRIELVKKFSDLDDEETQLFSSCLKMDIADRMIENVLGTFEIPLGIAVNFLINNKDYLIPMAIEESSVVAAASNAAKIARIKGGFQTECTDPLMIGQIQILHIDDIADSAKKILNKKEEILKFANRQDEVLVKFGGGAKDIEVRILDSPLGKMIVVHLIVDVRDAMGANAVNTMCEALAPILEEITGGKVRLRILSNLADKRIVKAKAVFDKEKIGGEKVVDAFLESYNLAAIDPYRAAIEAGAHAYAARDGQYTSLSHYYKDKNGNLVGELELPMAVGIIGGAGNIHPKAKLCKKILGIKTAKELAEIVVSLGLAQNFAAVFALSTVGIQKGHMSLHAKNIAVMAGAQDDEIEKVAEQMIKEGNIKLNRAEEILKEIR